jgi:hypothetical protein
MPGPVSSGRTDLPFISAQVGSLSALTPPSLLPLDLRQPTLLLPFRFPSLTLLLLFSRQNTRYDYTT